jgi:hypothetical protein
MLVPGTGAYGEWQREIGYLQVLLVRTIKRFFREQSGRIRSKTRVRPAAGIAGRVG